MLFCSTYDSTWTTQQIYMTIHRRKCMLSYIHWLFIQKDLLYCLVCIDENKKKKQPYKWLPKEDKSGQQHKLLSIFHVTHFFISSFTSAYQVILL